MIKHLILAVALIFSLFPFKVAACDQTRQIPQDIVDQADKIIIARAISSKWTSEKKPHFSDNFFNFIHRVWLYDELYTEGQTVFKVERVLKGKSVEYIKIRHDVSESACGITFNTNDNHLIFVQEREGKYFTNVFGIRPLLSTEEYEELMELVGVKESDHIKKYQNYLEPFQVE